MTEHVTGTPAEMAAYKATVDKANGFPHCRHVHIGGGRHIVVDPKTPGSPGWTMGFADVVPHPIDKDLCAHVKVDIPSAVPKELSQEEVTAVEAKNAEAKELTEDWYGSDIETIETS